MLCLLMKKKNKKLKLSFHRVHRVQGLFTKELLKTYRRL